MSLLYRGINENAVKMQSVKNIIRNNTESLTDFLLAVHKELSTCVSTERFEREVREIVRLINRQDISFTTILCSVCHFHHPTQFYFNTILTILLEFGADPYESVLKGLQLENPFEILINSNNTPDYFITMVETLKENRKFDINRTFGSKKFSLLGYTCNISDAKSVMCMYLLKTEASTIQLRFGKVNFFIIAASRCLTSVVKFMLKKNMCDVNVKDGNGYTALLAVTKLYTDSNKDEFMYKRLIHTLIVAGADPRITLTSGVSCLSLLAGSVNLEETFMTLIKKYGLLKELIPGEKRLIRPHGNGYRHILTRLLGNTKCTFRIYSEIKKLVDIELFLDALLYKVNTNKRDSLSELSSNIQITTDSLTLLNKNWMIGDDTQEDKENGDEHE
jgi:hypothetical protein